MHNVARAQLLRLSSINRRTSNFMRLDRFRCDHGSAHNQRGCASVDHQDVGLSFVKFGAAVTFAMGNPDHVVSVGAQRLERKFLIVNLAGEFLPGILDRGALPETKALRIGGAEQGSGSEKHNQQREYFH
jgi:hypothetical protein